MSVRSTDQHTTWTAVAHTHTEHNCRMYMFKAVPADAVLCCTVSPIYTRMLILNSRTVLLLYTSKIIQYIWANDKNVIS